MSTLPFPIDVETGPEFRAASRRSNRAGYAARLAAVLGNGAEWDYRGECTVLLHASGKCSCGHSGLKYLFRLHHPDGRSVIVGSTCIVNYPGISARVAEQLASEVERLQSAGRQRAKLALQAAQTAEVQALMAQWSEAEYRTDEATAAWHNRNQWARWYPTPIYRRPMAQERLAELVTGKLHPYCRVTALKTTAGQVKRLREYLRQCAVELESVRAAG